MARRVSGTHAKPVQPQRGHQSDQGPDSALERRHRVLMLRYETDVRIAARRFGVATGDIDDIVQRVFLIVLSKLGQIQLGSERAFVVAVARREAAHMRRTYRRRSETHEEAAPPYSSGQPRPDDSFHRRSQLLRVLDAMARIDPTSCEALVKSSVYGWSCERIAQGDGIPVGTVKSRIRRARLELKEQLAWARGTAECQGPLSGDGPPSTLSSVIDTAANVTEPRAFATPVP